MVQTAADLQQLKGVGRVLGKRLYDAGFNSFAKIAQAGEEGLKKVRGVSPRAISSILEQAKQLSEAPQLGGAERDEAVQKQLSEVREKIQTLAQAVRERFQEELAGKCGRKLTSDLVRIENALEQMDDGGRKRKRAGKALIKAEKRVAGLEDASLKKVRKGLKRARKAVLKAL
jgi:DNA-binding transcriptional MerR regulator